MCDPAATASPAPCPSAEKGARRPWYAESFDRGYLERYPRRNRAEAAAAIGLLASRVPLEERVVLDLACGAGRHIAPLLAQGARRVIGLDLSEALLAVARDDLEPDIRAGRVELMQGDMRALPLAEAAAEVVVNFFTSFGYFETQAEDQRVLAEVVRVLCPGGAFLLDFFNAPKVLADLVAEETLLVDGEPHRVERWYDEPRGRLEKRVWAPHGEVCLRESVRAYEPAQLHDLAAQAGLTLLEAFGGYDGTPFDPATSPRVVGLYRKEIPARQQAV